jgi:hypothetical protein
MAQRLKLTVPDPQDILDTYSAGALMRIERSSDYTVDDPGSANWSELSTKAIVAGTTEYEYIDATGVAGTHWGRTRFSVASPNSADDYSGYSTPFLYGALPGGPLSLETAKLWGSYEGTADEGWMALAVDAVNRAGIGLIGVDLGPSPDTTRQYDASAVVANGRRLYIPGGIRSYLTVSTGDGTTWTAITSYVRVGPVSHSRPPGEPGTWIEVKPEATVRLDASYQVKVTATAFEGFGWEAWPMDLVQDALAAVQRMSLDRARGGNYPSEIAALRYLHAPLWRGYGARYFPMVR